MNFQSSSPSLNVIGLDAYTNALGSFFNVLVLLSATQSSIGLLILLEVITPTYLNQLQEKHLEMIHKVQI